MGAAQTSAAAQAEALLKQSAGLGFFSQYFDAAGGAGFASEAQAGVNSAMSAAFEVKCDGFAAGTINPPVWVYQTVVSVHLDNGEVLTSKGPVMIKRTKVATESLHFDVKLCMFLGTSFKGESIEQPPVRSHTECQVSCAKARNCKYWKWDEYNDQCDLLGSYTHPESDTSAASKHIRSGQKFCSWQCTQR